MLVMSERNFKAQELEAVGNRYTALLEVTESYRSNRTKRARSHAVDLRTPPRGEIENGSVQEIQIPDQCYLFDLEDDDGGENEFQETQCATTGRKVAIGTSRMTRGSKNKVNSFAQLLTRVRFDI
jgi:hypothetical protein